MSEGRRQKVSWTAFTAAGRSIDVDAFNVERALRSATAESVALTEDGDYIVGIVRSDCIAQRAAGPITMLIVRGGGTGA